MEPFHSVPGLWGLSIGCTSDKWQEREGENLWPRQPSPDINLICTPIIHIHFQYSRSKSSRLYRSKKDLIFDLTHFLHLIFLPLMFGYFLLRIFSNKWNKWICIMICIELQCLSFGLDNMEVVSKRPNNYIFKLFKN